ncbi:MAG: exo-alpha-sialidase [Acidobacteriales bacterium]|nr:exo-alpha-sialidase [Terriglobales bacterium]
MRLNLIRFICSVAILWLALPSFQQANPISAEGGKVKLLRTPYNGIQPQAVTDERGTLHLIYFAGEPHAGDIFYLRREAEKDNFSDPLRVNSQPGSAVAVGTIRGAHIAIGKNGRVHVAWNGSSKAEPRGPHNSSPMLYARTNDAGNAFERQRNLMQHSHELDGGGSIAADGAGNVYVAWHGAGEQKGEQHRRIWLARSADEGKTFAREVSAFNEETGACGCCGMRAFADRNGTVYLLYRTATQMTERGMYLLVSRDKGKTFRGERVDKWTLTSCPMSSVTITSAEQPKIAKMAWENNGQVFLASLDSKPMQETPHISAPGGTGKRKHPAIAVNTRGETILVWTEGTGWKKGGSLAWQVFDSDGKPTPEKGAADGVPVWGLATVVALPSGEFTIIY